MKKNPILSKALTAVKGQGALLLGAILSSGSLIIALLLIGFVLILVLTVAQLARGLPGLSTVINYLSGRSGNTESTSGHLRGSYRGINEALGKVTCSRDSKGEVHCNCSAIRPQLVTIDFMGRKVQVHRKAAPAFEAVVKDIKAAGIKYNFWNPSRKCKGNSGGTFNCRSIMSLRGPATTPSPHAYGIAIDINPGCNPQVSKQYPCPHDIPEAVIRIFKKHGFRWGGDYKSKCDAMHFEWMGW